jgi:putative transposase
MGNNGKTSHGVYDIKYHVVWIEIGKRLRELIRQICESVEIKIIKGHVSKDHVHMMVSAPPYISVSDMMKRI